MKKLFYCLDCKRIFDKEGQCEYCQSNNLKELTKNSPVNILGSKLKGRVLKIEDDEVRVIFRNESNEKVIKEYKPEQLKKVL
ncbi:hypothetical protein KQI89_13240 [Clostridium sp. MSJ-4]|uniref:Uncharacterized protein n=1 Tax=Clostridium simiarum TaxID=2841506 RepID=A0ABS6F2I9_9CLOT|nr:MULTISPECIES: hypothetical protein [Clostridium]MBU5592714.1 hypothetical protein [Clostridium simiarum]